MNRPLAYITRALPPDVLATIGAACDYRMWEEAETPVPRDVLLREIAAADGVYTMITDQVDAAFLDAAPRCTVVANMAVGYDNVDLPLLNERGVLLTNTPDVLTDTTADLAWALLLAASRRIVAGQKCIEADGWAAWSPMFLVGQEVSGATLGIVGAGRIGAAVARRAGGFGMRLLYHNRSRSPDLEVLYNAEHRTLPALLHEADFVVVTLPLSDETRGLFGAEQFAQMKPSAVFVNVARGAIVQEDALLDALQHGTIWAAGLDVFAQEPIRADHPLLALPNVVAVPHIGSATVQTRMAMMQLAARNLVAALTGQPVPTPVNPQVQRR